MFNSPGAEGWGTACLWRHVYFSPPFRLNTSHATTYVFKIFHRGLIILRAWFSHFKNRCCLRFLSVPRSNRLSWKQKRKNLGIDRWSRSLLNSMNLNLLRIWLTFLRRVKKEYQDALNILTVLLGRNYL